MEIDKSILGSYFKEHYLTNYLEGLYFSYQEDLLYDTILPGKTISDLPLVESRNLENYDKVIDYIKELGRLIDSFYNNYCKKDRQEVDKLYEYCTRQLFSYITCDIKAFVIESKEAGDKYLNILKSDYDYLLSIYEGSRMSSICYCKRYSHTSRYTKVDDLDAAETFWKMIKDVSKNNREYSYIGDYCNANSCVLPNVGLMGLFDLFRLNPEYVNVLGEDNVFGETFNNCLHNYLNELRSNMDISLETLELGADIYNNKLPTPIILNPIEFADKVNKRELISVLLENHMFVPESLARIYNLIFTENYG